MKTTRSQPTLSGPEPTFSAISTLAVTALLLALWFAVLIVVSYPVIASGAVVTAIVAGSIVQRAAKRWKQRARRHPASSTSSCVE